MKGWCRRVFWLWIALVMVCSIPAAAMAEDVVVICNKGVAVSELSKSDIKRIYLGKKGRWEDGSKINFAVLDKDEPSTIFLKQYVKKNPVKFNNYWKKMLFTGKGKGPAKFKKNKDMVEFVANTQGAIGFVTPSAKTDTVKILTVTD